MEETKGTPTQKSDRATEDTPVSSKGSLSNSSDIYSALFDIQSSLGAVQKNQEANAGKFSYSYADIGAVIDTIHDLLVTHKVLRLQIPFTATKEQHIGIETVLRHIPSATEIRREMEVPYGKPNDPQAYGGAITYARRYALISTLGLVVEDDDGNSAKPPEPGNRGRASSPNPSVPPNPPVILGVAEIRKKMNFHIESGDKFKLKLVRDYIVKNYMNLPREDADGMLETIENSGILPTTIK